MSKHNATPLIVGIGGTNRANSSSEKALQAALKIAQLMGARTLQISGPDLLFEIYQPEDTSRSDKATTFIDALKNADGLLISTPSYHGSIPGLLKNALDYIEDLRDDERPYLDNRAVGCIICADGSQALGSTLNALRSVIHAVRAWPTPYAATLPSAVCRQALNEPQNPSNPAFTPLQTVVEQVVTFADAMSQKVARPIAFDKPPQTALNG